MACAEERVACRARQRRYGGDKKRMACQLRAAAAPCSALIILAPVPKRYIAPAQDPAQIPPTPETSSDALTDQCDHRWAVRWWWQQLLSYDLATLLCVQLSSLPKIILSSTDYKMQWQPAGRWESFRMRSNQCKHTQYKRSGSSVVAQTFGSLA